MIYQYTTFGMTNIWKNEHAKGWPGSRGTGTLMHCWWESKIAKSFWKIVGHFLKMLPYDPADSILGIYPRENKACVHSRMFA